MKSTMKLLSSKKSGSRPSSAPPKPPQHPTSSTSHSTVATAASDDGIIVGNSSSSSSEVLQLRLENSELRSRLDDALSHTDESKSELLKLLEEQTYQTNALQRKCDELAAGFMEIDKERRALRKSADDARSDAAREVSQARDECEKRCGVLDGHLKVREKEVETLAERTREQERRIETVVNEATEKQSKIDEMEGELEELIGMAENEREERKKLEGEYGNALDVGRAKDAQLEEQKLVEKGLEERVRELQQTLVDEEGKWNMREEQLKKELEGKESEIGNLLQDQQLTKIEHEQAIQTMQDQLEATKVDYATQQENMAELHHKLQSQIDDKSNTIQSLKFDIEQLQSNHATKVGELKSVIEQYKSDNASIEASYQKSCEAASQLQDELNNARSNNQIEQEELKAANYLLEKESGELAEELDGTKVHLAAAKTKLGDLQTEHASLQSNHEALQHGHSELERQVSTLQGQIEQMAVDNNQAIAQKSKQISALEGELDEEKGVSNKLRSQLRELNIQLKESGSTSQKEKQALERDLESVTEQLSAKEEELKELCATYESVVDKHKSELESLRTDHAAQMMVIETRGADIVSDLEDAIGELEKELADTKSKHEQDISELQNEVQTSVTNMALEKERLERSLEDANKKMLGQDEKISSLTAYAKEKKEEVKSAKAELVHLRRANESAARDHETEVTAIRDELENARVLHEQEMSELQNIVDAVRLELSVAKERLETDDGELERAKATLSERTNLLRDMVHQTTAYQGDFEREHDRANQLEEKAIAYKRQLAEARGRSQNLEGEIHDKDKHYCDAIRNERQQRKAIETELESSRKSMEGILRKNTDIEKENSALKDKVQRQEKYISRLQDREKQNRRGSFRPSKGGARTSRSPVRNTFHKHRISLAVDENEMPNIGRSSSSARLQMPQSPDDERTSLLG